MKRLLFSLFCGFVLVLGYLGLVNIIYAAFRLCGYVISDQILKTMLFNLYIPEYIYQSILGFRSGKSTWLKIIIEILAVIVIHSIPFYLIFTLYSKIKKTPQKNEGIRMPPPPPQFDSVK